MYNYVINNYSKYITVISSSFHKGMLRSIGNIKLVNIKCI